MLCKQLYNIFKPFPFLHSSLLLKNLQRTKKVEQNIASVTECCDKLSKRMEKASSLSGYAQNLYLIVSRIDKRIIIISSMNINDMVVWRYDTYINLVYVNCV